MNPPAETGANVQNRDLFSLPAASLNADGPSPAPTPLRSPAALSARDQALICAGLIAVSLALYARAVGFDFVSFDDQTVLLAHPELYAPRPLAESLMQILWHAFPREEPLIVRDLTWVLDARLFGFESPVGYHLGNVVLNAAVTGLLFLFLARTLRNPRQAGWVALAFTLLPIHVEPVAWIMGRKDLLVALFMLLALLAQHAELTSPSSKRRWTQYGVGLLCTALALGSKISAVSFFLVLWLHRVLHPDLTARPPEAPAPTDSLFGRALRAGPWVLPHAVLSVTAFLAYRQVLADYGVIGEAAPEMAAPAPLSLEHIGNLAQFLPLILGQYLEAVFRFSDLSAYYRWPHVAIPLTTPQRALSIAIVLATGTGLAALLRWRRDLLFFALFPLLLMIPYSGLFYVGFWRADRYFYLAAAGVLVLAAAGLHQIGTRWPVAQRPIAVASAAFLGICAVSSASHQPVWQDSESLWHYEVQRTAPSMLAIQAYAKLRVQETEAARSREARLAAAEQALAWIARGFERKAELKLRPTNYWLPETNQEAQLHLLKGRVAHTIGAPAEQQVVHFRRAFELAPNRVSALLLSGALFQVSQQRPATDQPALLRESLDAFESYIALSGRDAQQLEESRVLLERNFSQRFPALEPRLAKIRSTYYR